jgi:hypothetical protein
MNMNSAARLILTASLFALVPSAAFGQAAPVPATASQASAHDRLFQLFKESDEASLKRNPIQAMFRGDLRYADRLGDLFSDAHFQGEKAAAEQDLAALHAIPRDQLNATDQIAYDVFEDQTEENLKGFAPDLLAINEALPMNHFFGIHTEYPTFASGQGAAPFKTLQDYENNLKRNRDFAANIDEAIAQWKKGEDQCDAKEDRDPAKPRVADCRDFGGSTCELLNSGREVVESRAVVLVGIVFVGPFFPEVAELEAVYCLIIVEGTRIRLRPSEQ